MKWETCKEAAHRFGVSTGTVWAWGKLGKVKVRMQANPGIRPICLYLIGKQRPKRKYPFRVERQITKRERQAIALLKASGLPRYRVYLELGG